MAAVEKGVEIFRRWSHEGVGGLWQMLLDKLGDLKETVIGRIKDFVITKIIKAGITWLICAAQPRRGLHQGLQDDLRRRDVLRRERQPITEFVNTVLDSVGRHRPRHVGGVATKIDDGSAKSCRLIGFLASLLGLGGIGEKIREILGRSRSRSPRRSTRHQRRSSWPPRSSAAPRGRRKARPRSRRARHGSRARSRPGRSTSKARSDAAKARLTGKKPAAGAEIEVSQTPTAPDTSRSPAASPPRWGRRIRPRADSDSPANREARGGEAPGAGPPARRCGRGFAYR